MAGVPEQLAKAVLLQRRLLPAARPVVLAQSCPHPEHHLAAPQDRRVQRARPFSVLVTATEQFISDVTQQQSSGQVRAQMFELYV